MRAALRNPLFVTVLLLAALVFALHRPVLTRGAIVTPVGMHFAQWPWKPYAAQAVAGGFVPRENPVLSDLLFQVYPSQRHIARSLESGSVPLWNPYSYSGVPFVANAQSALFYPLHWPVWLLPSMQVFSAALLLKILLAGLFMAVFLRGLGLSAAPAAAGSIAFALSGFMTSWLGYPLTNAAIALPLLMHAARMMALRPGAGAFLLLAIAGAGQYLGGHPETSLHIVGAAAAYFLWCLRDSPRPKAAGVMFGGAGLLGFALAAVQMLPFVEYLLESAALRIRLSMRGADPALPLESLITWLVPGYYGRPENFTWVGPVPFNEVIGYAGGGVAALALASLGYRNRPWFFHLLAAASLLVAYGPRAFRDTLRVIPVVGVTSNNRVLLLLGFSLAVLAAHSLEAMGRGIAAGRRPGRLRLVAPPATAALPLVGAAWWAAGADPVGARLAAGLVIATALIPALALLRPARAWIYQAAIVALVCVDMFQFAYGFNPHADPDALFPPTRLTDFLRQDAAVDMVRGGRLMTIGWVMRPDTQMIYRLSSIEGYDSMEIDRYRKLLDRADVATVQETGLVQERSRPLLDLLGTRYFVTPPGGVVSGEAMRLAYDAEDGRVFINEQATPRFRFTHRAGPIPPGDLAGLEAVASRPASGAGTVLLEEGAASGWDVSADPAEPAPSARIELHKNAPGWLEVEVSAHPRDGWLVVSETWQRGWKATVNGRPAPVLRADYSFLAVRVPAGKATVSLRYRPLSFRIGVWVSALALLFFLATALVHWSGAWRE